MSQVIKLLNEDDVKRAEGLLEAIDFLRMEAVRLNCAEAVVHLDASKKSVRSFINFSRTRYPSVGG